MSRADTCLLLRQEEAGLRGMGGGLPHSHTMNKLQSLDQSSDMHVSFMQSLRTPVKFFMVKFC